MTRDLLERCRMALEYHQSQTRPIYNTTLVIDAIREELAKPLVVPERNLDYLTDALERMISAYGRAKPPGYPASDAEKAATAALARYRGQTERPVNCGTGHCSCIECVVPEPAAQARCKPMTREQIRAEWDEFIEYPNESRLYVTTTSALLFAEHIAAKCIKDAP